VTAFFVIRFAGDILPRRTVLVFTAEGYIELPSLKSENVAVRSRRRQHSNQYREETVANYNGNKYKKPRHNYMVLQLHSGGS